MLLRPSKRRCDNEMRRWLPVAGVVVTTIASWAGYSSIAEAATQVSSQSALVGARDYLNLLVGFIVIVLLMIILFRFLGKRVGVQQRGTINIVAAKQVAPNRSIQVVEVGQKLYLLGVGENIELLADVTDTYDQQNGDIVDASLGQALQSTLAELRSRSSKDG